MISTNISTLYLITTAQSPHDYNGISDKQRRITAFCKDGFSAISAVLCELGFMVGINISKRY